MRDLAGKVAVITGGAGGIGRAMGERFGREGMKVVLADIDDATLQATVTELRRAELDVVGVRCDVSSPESVEALAQETLRHHGKVNLVCNNAGVFLAGKTTWEATLKDWQWIMGVNVWGVVHGIRTFVPLMLDSGEECHIINTASQGGLITGSSIYGMTKHAVVALSEALHLELQRSGANIGVSALCPLFVDTKIMESERNRPPELWNAADGPEDNPRAGFLAGSTTPEQQAEMVLEGLLEGRFYIFPFMQQVDDNVRGRFEDIIERRNPVPRPMR